MFAAGFLKKHRAPFCDIVNGHVIFIYTSFTLYTIYYACVCLIFVRLPDICVENISLRDIALRLSWKPKHPGCSASNVSSSCSPFYLFYLHHRILCNHCLYPVQQRTTTNAFFMHCVCFAIQIKNKTISLISRRRSSYNGPFIHAFTQK